ncbi:PREDICTED: B3 domain-containing protein At3g06220-like isoform X2 [Camelina sativa]|uniref:B3 domain-containing protein At3g06220-like isoform X2 n=1 Tax=Camelina sativa TaxID=90675 RepID=A0ABM0SQ69_CAMSA|nr:PREDICTED: B3 domain-containing protein At3g06220-like isoform X2 [Camelina sativa]
MASGDVLPRFFSVYLSQYSSDSLLIPVSYYEHLPRPLPKTGILMGTGGKIWKVAMKSRQEQVYFERGWANFVADNDIKDGEFLIFVFDGYRRYEVSIFAHGGCKEIRAAVEVEEISDGTESENNESSLESVIQDEEEEAIDADAKSDTLTILLIVQTQTTISVESAEVRLYSCQLIQTCMEQTQ